jgi:hypothetical protein
METFDWSRLQSGDHFVSIHQSNAWTKSHLLFNYEYKRMDDQLNPKLQHIFKARKSYDREV